MHDLVDWLVGFDLYKARPLEIRPLDASGIVRFGPETLEVTRRASTHECALQEIPHLSEFHRGRLT